MSFDRRPVNPKAGLLSRKSSRGQTPTGTSNWALWKTHNASNACCLYCVTRAKLFFFSHLAHRLFLQSSLLFHKAIFFLLRGWEEDFVEPPDAPQPQQEAAQRRSIRQRSQKSKIHHFNTKFPARKVKTGSRQMRRHENS